MASTTPNNIDSGIIEIGRELYFSLVKRIPTEIIESAVELDIELYAVGGSIRDWILGRTPGDIDLAVVGDAAQLAERAARKLDISDPIIYARFGTALLQTKYGKFEFASARKESYQPESRNPHTSPVSSIEEDLQRRDFTVNALALCLTGIRKGVLLDLFGGFQDIKHRLLRTPLQPDVTFSDDPLRMLRAVRFAADLDFDLDDNTRSSIVQNSTRIRIVARERIGDEFYRMLAGNAPARAMSLLVETGLMENIIPEVTAMAGVEQVGRHAHKDVLIHSLKVMQNTAEMSPDPIVRLAGLLHDIGKPRTKRYDEEIGWTFHAHEALGAKMAQRIGRRLCLGKDNLERLVNLVRLHMRPVNLTDEGVTDSAIRRLMADAGNSLDEQLILCRADITTANPRLVSRYLANFEEMEKRMSDVNARDRMRKFQSPIRGEEIMEICNIPAGLLVGAFKGRIEDAILDGRIAFDYSAAKEYLLQIKDEILGSDLETLSKEIRERSRARKNVGAEDSIPDFS